MFSYLKDTWQFFGKTFERQGAFWPRLLYPSHLKLGTTHIWNLKKDFIISQVVIMTIMFYIRLDYMILYNVLYIIGGAKYYCVYYILLIAYPIFIVAKGWQQKLEVIIWDQEG